MDIHTNDSANEGTPVEAELRKLLAAFNKYRQFSGRQRAGEISKKLVEVPLQEFFAKGLPAGFRSGNGARPPRSGTEELADMDITIDDVTNEWHGRSRILAAGGTVQVHMEVAAYAKWSPKKVTEDLDSLHRSMDEASAAGTTCWTSLVLAGGECEGAQEKITAFLHDYYHARLSRPRRGAPSFVDAVIVPGMYLMKHWMFEEQRYLPSSNTAAIANWEVVWAAMMEHPLHTRDDLVSVRPLALARAFLHRYLRSVAAGTVLPQLWSSEAEKRDVEGPLDDADARAWAERGHCICLEDRTPTHLYHYGPQTYERDPSLTCRKKSAYRFAPREMVARALFSRACAFGSEGKRAEEIAAYDEVIVRFASATEPALQELVARALFSKGCVFATHGQNVEAITAYDEVLVRIGNATEPVLQELVARAKELVARTLFSRACALVGEGKRVGEITAYDELLVRFASATDPVLQELVTGALFCKGYVLGVHGYSAEAIAAYDGVLVRIGNATEPTLQTLAARALFNKGIVLSIDKKRTHAIATYDALIARFGAASELAQRELVAMALVNKGALLGIDGKYAEAVAAYDDVIARFGAATELTLREQVAMGVVNKRAILSQPDAATVPKPQCPA